METFDETDLFGSDELSAPAYPEELAHSERVDAEGDGDRDSDDMSFCFSEVDLIPDDHGLDITSRDRQARQAAGYNDVDDDDDYDAIEPTFVYALDEPDYPGPKFTYSKTLLVSQRQDDEAAGAWPKAEAKANADRRSKRLSRSFSSFSQKSQAASRRSMSPRKGLAKDNEARPKSSNGSSNVRTPRREEVPAAADSAPSHLDRSDLKLASRRRSMLSPWKREIDSAGSRSSDSTSTTAAANSLSRTKSHRSDRSAPNFSLPYHTKNKRGVAGIKQSPQAMTNGNLKEFNNQYFFSTDELGAAFRTIEADHQKLEAKSTTAKASIIRSSVLPFLKKTATHPSNKRVRPEFLDKRVKILSSWWTSMLDMLSGKDKNNVSAVDRLSLLDGITLIMERPEWRAPPSPFCSLIDRVAFARANGLDPQAVNEGNADELDYVLEAVCHDVRNNFVQNLFSQVVYVVDRMSMRNAPANLVKFCGKTCAFAFLFCPGVAETLVRHWRLSGQTISKIFAACGHGDLSELEETSLRIQRLFPQCVESLAIGSARATIEYLKSKPILPMGLEKLHWHGSWTARWTGKESELFFVFVDHFHQLAADFLPSNATSLERSCVPATVLVHAQILVILESTIRRQSGDGIGDPAKPSKAAAFDDFMTPDGSSLAPDGLAALLAKASRSMTENSLIVLLRNFISRTGTSHDQAAKLFTQGFCGALKAAAKSTSLYDHEACFNLLDFLQESFISMAQYEATTMTHDSLLDWPFWVDAFKKMVSSENTMTEMRLYTFLFTLWDALGGKVAARETLSLDFLLDAQVFYTRFNHWCPMVRAFFQRLVCWRLARFDGDTTESNLRIYSTLMDRLLVVWSHYKFFAEKAEKDGFQSLATNPSNPAPGRRLLIIRTDLLPNGSDASNGGIPQRHSSLAVSSLSAPSETENQSAGDRGSKAEQGKKRNSVLWNFMAPRPPADDGSAQNIPASNGSAKDQDSRASIYASRPTASSLKPGEKQNKRQVLGAAAGTSQRATFKFSMEYVGTRPHASMAQVSLTPPKLPLPALSCLKSRPGHREDVPVASPPRNWEGSTRYAGRALAEWALVVNECQNFFERRRKEGVLLSKNVETPTLSVDPFRRPLPTN